MKSSPIKNILVDNNNNLLDNKKLLDNTGRKYLLIDANNLKYMLVNHLYMLDLLYYYIFEKINLQHLINYYKI